jgi:hypothetical protein
VRERLALTRLIVKLEFSILRMAGRVFPYSAGIPEKMQEKGRLSILHAPLWLTAYGFNHPNDALITGTGAGQRGIN